MSELADHLELYGTIWDCLGLEVGLLGTMNDWDMKQDIRGTLGDGGI